MKVNHLIIALGNSWGRASTAVSIWRDLEAAGESSVIIVNKSVGNMLSEDTRHISIRNDIGPIVGLYLNQMFETHRPRSVVLCDFFGNANFLLRNGVRHADLVRAGARTIAVDLWDSERTGHEADVFGEEAKLGRSAASIDDYAGIDQRIYPVPIIDAAARPQASFRNLPAVTRQTPSTRRAALHELGIPRGDKAVLFCTARWQHVEYPSGAGRRLAALLPLLLAGIIERMGKRVHLVHVGPRPYELDALLPGRYHWLDALRPTVFDRLLTAADLMVSANVSATTIARSIVARVPVLLIRNSFRASSIAEIEGAIARPVPSWARATLAAALPVHPFVLWPLGCHRLLAPTLEGNPYMQAVEAAELLDVACMESKLRTLLEDRKARDGHIRRQAAYVSAVSALPSVAEVVSEQI